MDESLTDFVVANEQAYQREADMVSELGKLMELVQGLKDLAIAGKIGCFAEDSIKWRELSAFHSIQVRAEEAIEQVHVIDAVRARPFIDEPVH